MPTNAFAPAPSALSHGPSCACARCASARAMISGPYPPKRTAACADCGQSDPARLALPVNREYRCRSGCAADAGAQIAQPAESEQGESVSGDCACPPRCHDCAADMHFLCLACRGVPEHGASER